MNIFILSLRGLKRDWHAGELTLIAMAIIIAVASLTSVSFFTDRIRNATETRATELLAADLVLRSNEPIPASVINTARSHDLIITRTTSFRSMVVTSSKLELAEVKAVESGYPVRGQLKVSDSLFGTEYTARVIPEPGTVWIDSRLLQILDLEIGDSINLGISSFEVARILTYEPDRGGDLFNIAPRLLMNLDDLEGTRLILPGSRIQYRLLLGGQTDNITKFRHEMERQDSEIIRVQGIRDARPELKTALERAERFLGLAVLISIALAGMAIAMSAQQYTTRHFDHCAILRCLGAQQNTIVKLYSIQLLILSVISSLAGCGLGYLAQEILTSIMSSISRNVLPGPSLLPVFTGLAAGVITALGFALPQILRLRSVPPLRVLRRELEPLPVKNITIYLYAILALVALSPWQAGNQDLTLLIFSGLIFTAILLALSARLFVRTLNIIRNRVGVSSRYGLSNVIRRSNHSTGQIVAVGLGIMVMLLLTLVRTDLLDAWQGRLPEDTPNYFLINIQPDEVSELQSKLQQQTGIDVDLYPMVRGRLMAINQDKTGPENYQEPRAQRLVSREFNLSWARNMQPDNRLVKGGWWSENEKDIYFSVEEGIAETLGIETGDRLTYRIADQTITGLVKNIRWVEWDSFNVNFFVVANPGSIEKYPATYITSFYLPQADKTILNNLVREFPSITIIDVDAILTQVRQVMDQVIKAIEFVFIFTLMAGILVLVAALQTTHDERVHESALLRALGASHKQIMSGMCAEFIALGLLAGILAAFAATIMELLLAKFIFHMEITVTLVIWFAGPLAGTVIIVLAGIAATRHVLSTPPIVVLQRG